MKPPKTIGQNTVTDTQAEVPFTEKVNAPQMQRNNALHGITLEAMLTTLVAHFGWADLAEHIPVRCFSHDPSIASSLKFFRRTPWAREKVEGLYTFMLRDIERNKTDNIT